MNISNEPTQPEGLTVANSLIYSVPVSIAVGVILSIFTLMTIVFNLGGALIFLLDKELHTFSDRLITNLVIADGSIGLLVMPVKVILALTSDVWVWSRPLCLTFITVEATTNLVSVINTFIVTLDHYWLVRKRQNYTIKQTRRLLLFMCITPWVSVFVFFGSPHFLAEFVLSNITVKPGACVPPFQHDLGIFLILLVSPFIPIIAVPVYDSLIYFTLRRQLFTKVKDLAGSGTIDTKYLEAFGIEVGTDAKDLGKVYAKKWRSSLQNEVSKDSESGTNLDDYSISEATSENIDAEIESTTQATASHVTTPHVTNSNCNANEAAAQESSTDVNNPSRSWGKAATQVVPLPLVPSVKSAAGYLLSGKTGKKEAGQEAGAAGLSGKEAVAKETAPNASQESVATTVAGQEASQESVATTVAGQKASEHSVATTVAGQKESKGAVAKTAAQKASKEGVAQKVAQALKKKKRKGKKKTQKGVDVEQLQEYATDMKEARLSLMLGTVLIVTCTPFESLNFIVAICDIIQICTFQFPPRLLQGCRWWVLLSSTVNPVLIFSLDHRYRAGFFRFFRRLRGKSITDDNVSSGTNTPV